MPEVPTLLLEAVVELGRQLRTRRRLGGRKLVDVARAAGMSDSQLSRIELGRILASELQVRSIAEALDLPADITDHLTSAYRALHRQVANPSSTTLPITLSRLANFDERATIIRQLAVMNTPGLLQTPEFAAAAFAHFGELRLSGESDDVRSRLFERVRRQPLLYDTSKTFQFLLCETGILNNPGASMSAQYDRIIEVARFPNVEVRVLPRSSTDWPAMVGFRVYDDAFATTESFPTDLLVTDPMLVTFYVNIFNKCWDTSLRDDDSIALLSKLKREAHQRELGRLKETDDIIDVEWSSVDQPDIAPR